MISNNTHRLGKIIWLLLGVSAVFLATGNSYADAPAPLFKIIKTKSITDDAKVEALWENADPSDSKSRYNVGTVQKQQDGKEWLMVKGQKIFEGYTLGKAVSSSDGTIAVSSFSGLRNQVDGDGSDGIYDKNGKLIQSVSSIWLIDPAGAKHKITGDDIHATYPVLSRDGHWLAYLGQPLNDKGIPGAKQLYVVSIQSNVASAPVTLSLPSMSTTMPIRWDRNDQLVVLAAQDENSSACQLAWVQITPGQ